MKRSRIIFAVLVVLLAVLVAPAFAHASNVSPAGWTWDGWTWD